jgi:hypothetical protein
MSGRPEISSIIKIVEILAFRIHPDTNKHEQRSNQFFRGLSSIIECLSQKDLESLKEAFYGKIDELT